MSTRDQDTETAIAHGSGSGEVATGEGGVERNPVLVALEAYNRAHPYRQVDPEQVLAEAEHALDEDSEAVPAPADASGDDPAAASEEPLWADDRERQEQWWQRI